MGKSGEGGSRNVVARDGGSIDGVERFGVDERGVLEDDASGCGDVLIVCVWFVYGLIISELDHASLK